MAAVRVVQGLVLAAALAMLTGALVAEGVKIGVRHFRKK